MTDGIKAFTMPKWGIEMEEGVIREWHAEVGDEVKEGELFVVIETDKIANDVELEYSSKLRWRIAKEGDSYAVGALIAIFADENVSDENVETFRNNFKAVDASFGTAELSKVAEKTAADGPLAQLAQATSEIPADTSMSPLARKLAESLSVDLSALEGSGLEGRFSLQDVEQAAKAQGLMSENHPSKAGIVNIHKVIKLSSMRKTIAKRLTQANQNIPHFYLRTKINMDALIAARKQNRQGSVNDYVIKACATALIQEPEVNVHFMGDSIHQYAHADISVAVATDRGLITPIVRAADTKSIEQISAEMIALSQKANAEKLQPSDYQGGTFSVSNLGMMGVTSFDAIINPPMGAILAVGTSETVHTEGGGKSSVMSVTLSCDHRAIDGSLGARWLQVFKSAMENPQSL